MIYYPSITNQIGGNTAGATANISSGTMLFAGGNNITLSQNGNSVTISAGAGGAGGNNTMGMSNLGNTSGTTGVVSGSAIQFAYAGGNNVTLSQSINGSSATITISAANQTVESQSFGMSNLGNTSGTTGIASGAQMRMLLAGGNNITLSQSINGASATITISAPNAVAQTNQTVGLYALGNTTQNSSTTLDARSLSFNGLGIITAGYSGGSIQISATQSLQTSNVHNVTLSGNTAGVMAQISSGTLTLAGGNNITLSQNGNAVTISAGAGGAGGTNTFGMSNLGNTSGTTGVISGTAVQFAYAGGNNVTLSQSINGSSATITISAFNQTAESQTMGMSNLGNTSGTTGVASGAQVRMLFAGGNNITLSQSVNGASATITISAPNTVAQTNQTIGLYALGNTTQNSSTTLDARTLSFNGLGIVTAGYSNGSIQISATQSVQSQNLFNLTLSGNTAGVMAQVSSGTLTLAGGNNITLSQNGNAVTISAANNGQFTASTFEPVFANSASQFRIGHGSLAFWPITANQYVTATRVRIFGSNSFSTSSNSSFGATISYSLGIYSRNGTSFSQLSSGSASYTMSDSTGGNTSLYSGVKHYNIPINMNITPGQYYMGLVSKTASVNANWASLSNMIVTNGAVFYNDEFGSTAPASRQFVAGRGMYSISLTGALISSLGLSDLAVSFSPGLLPYTVFEN